MRKISFVQSKVIVQDFVLIYRMILFKGRYQSKCLYEGNFQVHLLIESVLVHKYLSVYDWQLLGWESLKNVVFGNFENFSI